MAVSPQHFAEQMEVICKHYSPLSLNQLVEALQAGEIPRRAVALTFDDGYVDNLYQAKPVLERYGIPATVFVTAGQVGSKREFWWDELDRILLQPGSLPDKLHLKMNGNVYEWLLADTALYTEENFQRGRTWHVECKEDPSQRQHIFRNLYGWLRSLPFPAQQKILDDLQSWACVEGVARPTHRALSFDELILLEKGGLIQIGAHTITHPDLATLPAAEQRNEIEKGREFLEAILEHPVTNFAYPYGSSNLETITILRDLNFLCACSSDPDAVWRDANRFALPRVVVRDWEGKTFERWLRWWVGR
jgi:peptidoglycan/xylan/chitin deacetylase (PgdA/CDA1 family)